MKPIIPMSVFKERREKLLNMIGDAVLLLPAAPECTRNRDCHYAYRQDSDFIYLSNFDEPEAVIVLDGKNKKSILFGRVIRHLGGGNYRSRTSKIRIPL